MCKYNNAKYKKVCTFVGTDKDVVLPRSGCPSAREGTADLPTVDKIRAGEIPHRHGAGIADWGRRR